MSVSPYPTRGWLALALLLVGAGCGDADLEVRGELSRVVGETVTLVLQEGDPTFSGDVTVRAADSAQLKVSVNKKDDRNLSFVVPADIAPGKATALVARNGGGTYDVELQINRLALALDDKGSLELIPLNPASLARSAQSLGAAQAMVALSPAGGELATYVNEEVRLRALGREIKDVAGALKQAGGVCLGAIPGGALVATSTDLILFRFVKGQQTTMSTAKIAGSCKALAVGGGGSVIAVLSACDTNSDAQNEDCVTVLRVGAELTVDKTVSVDATPNATVVGVTGDGKGIVLADADNIHGVYIEDIANPLISKWPWGYAAQPASMDHALTPVRDMPSNIDIFAVADKASGKITFVGFNPKAANALQKTSEVAFSDGINPPGPKPVAVSYGRRTELYVAADNRIYVLDSALAAPPITDLGLSLGSAILSLLVQP